MNKSESIAKLGEALAKAQSEIEGAHKDGTNPHLKNKYATIAAIWDACRAPLSKNGLAVVQAPANSTEGRISLETMIIHSSGEWISEVFSTRLPKDDPQGVGSALTYLRRYALAAMVGVVQDDDDGEGTKRTNGKEPSHAANVWKTWTALCAEAAALGLPIPSLDYAAEDKDVIAAGKQLRAAVEAAKKVSNK